MNALSLRAALHPVAVLVSVALLGGVLLPMRAAAADDPARPRIGLVLSGGGARGLTHVGVLKVLERERIPVDVIAGTSMGAIVGGLYATGMTAGEVEQEVLRLDWDNVFASRVERRELSQRRKEQDFEVAPLFELGIGADGVRAPLGPVSSHGLEAHLRRLTLPARQYTDFDQMPTPFRAVATDMETGQPVILKGGDLATALRSSMSVPGVFAPVEVNGRILGDGGLVNNTPVDVARAMGAERLIVVNIGTPLSKRDTLSSFTGVTAQMINILTEQNVQRNLATLTPRDVLIAPTLDGLTAADFNRAREFMNQGEIQAEALVLRMQDLKVSETEYARWQAQRKARPLPKAGPLREVRFNGSNSTHPDSIAETLETRAGEEFDVGRAERDLRRLAATGDYLRTDYRLERMPDGEGLVFDLQDKPWGPDYIQLGLDFSADTEGRSAFNLKLVHNRHWLDDSGAEWRNFVRLGSTPSILTEWYRPVGWQMPDGLRAFVAVNGGLQRRSTDVYLDPVDKPVLALSSISRTVGADVGLTWRELGEVRLGWSNQWGRDEPELISARWQGVQTTQRWTEKGFRLRGVFDQLDSAYFPTQGWRFEGLYFNGERDGHDLSQPARGHMSRWDLNAQAAASVGPHIFQVAARVAGATGALPELPRYGLGGFQQLSGYAADQLSGQQVALVRAGYAVRLATAPLTRGVYLGGSLEAGNAWERWNDPDQGRWRHGMSLYLGADTSLGPVFAAIGAAQGVRPVLMIFVGRP